MRDVISRVLLVLLAALLVWPLLAFSQDTQPYTVEIRGAGRHNAMLEEFLDITRQTDSSLPPDQVERLIAITPQQIRDLLATEGYFTPTIRPALDRSGTRWTARFDIELGEPVRIGTVTIRFKGGIATGPSADTARMDRLRARWKLEPGDLFRQSAWSDAKSDLLKDLLARDYPAAALAFSEARIDAASHLAALTIEVDSGPAFTFGELNIQGLERYTRDMIDNLNPIHPGDPYSQEKLNELQARLQDTGYFRSAFATVDIDPAHPKQAPVRLDLAENPRKRLSLGIGFSTDSGPRIQARWLDRNFLLRDWRLESQVRLDRDTKQIGGDVYLPPVQSGLLPHGWLPSFGAHLEQTTSAGETTDKLRTGVRLASPNRVDEKAWALTYYGDRQRIGDVFLNNRQALIASLTYTRRRVDNPLQPKRGYIASVELGSGLQGVINEASMARVVARGLLLRPFASRWQAVLRGQVGQVFGGSRLTVPADLLFRTGGDQTVRGYGYNTLGVPQDGAIVGGTVTAVASAELVYQVTPDWGAAAFIDAGNAADSWRGFTMKAGSGVGARWRSPIGPVNVDLAYGHDTRKIRLHFSVGYGF